MFKIGEKVVCIDVSDPKGNLIHHKELPKLDGIYTIRRTYQWEDTWGVLLEELKNPSVPIPVLGGKVEVGFNYKRFRSLDKVKSKPEILEEELLA